MIYSDWADNVPNSPLHTCMVLNRDAVPGYKWDDEHCSETHGYVCEKGNTSSSAIFNLHWYSCV